MRKNLLLAAFGLSGALTASAGTSPIYINFVPLVSPPSNAPSIDATAFVNQSQFDVNTGFFILPGGGFFFFNSLPFQTANTLFFTNRSFGEMSSDTGFRFDFITNSVRLPMANWVNQGSISAGSTLWVNSSNITSTGPLNAGPAGIIRLTGGNINLQRIGLRSGQLPGLSFFGGFLVGVSNYIDPGGITDVYWGAGANNRLDNLGTPMLLNRPSFPFQPNFDVPNTLSPLHHVLFAGSTFTNSIQLPRFGLSFFGTNFFFGTNSFLSSYSAVVYTNTTSPTSTVVQVVFIPTNSFDTNFSLQVRFGENFGIGPAAAIVQFGVTDFDIITGTLSTNFVYLIDRAALGTNIFLAQNLIATTKRPNTYEITRDTPFGWINSVPGNATFTPSLIYNTGYLSNAVPVIYGAYAAQISSVGLTNASAGSLFVTDPTNLPGRVEIIGDAVNLDRTRIRAESTTIIRAKNLSSNHVALVDAPFCYYDLTSLQPDLVISNLAPVSVRRVGGEIAAWTGIWDNPLPPQVISGVTNFPVTQFHVLIVENDLQSLTPVIVNELALHGTNIVIYDLLSVNQSILLEGKALNVIGGLSFPPGVSWVAGNVLNVLNFTNFGIVAVSGAEFQGSDRPAPYANYVNRGTNTAAGHFIRANNFDNSGCLVANAGVISLVANTASLSGAPQVTVTNFFTNFFSSTGIVSSVVFTNVVTNSFGAKLQANGDVQISANSLVTSNSLILAGGASPGALILSVTNSLTDGGQGAINNWLVTAGFQALQLPATNDLLATYLRSTVPANAVVSHVWAGRDLGPVNAGYTNNLALGKLTLDSVDSSAIQFTGASQSNALYVDYLELLNNAANYNGAFIFDTNITIYFANANVAVSKLDGSNDGHFRWVPTFAGPLSSTNITYPDGFILTANIALVQSKDIDSDGDGLFNYYDRTPLPEPASLALTIAMQQFKALAPRALISWNTVANCNNHLECKRSLTDTNWVTVTNFYTGPINTRVSVSDSLSNDPLRIYRVWMEMPPR